MTGPVSAEPTSPTARNAKRRPLAHLTLLSVGIFFVMWLTRHAPDTATAIAPGGTAAAAPVAPAFVPSTLAHFLTAMITISLTGWALGKLAPRVGQPPVMGEVVGGLLLGPSFLGLFFPAAAAVLLPKDSLPALNMMAQLGVTFFMFAIGLELDVDLLKKRGFGGPVIANASIVFPFVLGTALARPLYTLYAPPGVAFPAFALFIGVSLAITAFPVLARILKDTGKSETRLGVMAIACAALGDVAAWCLLAFVACIATSGHAGAGTTSLDLVFPALRSVAATFGFAALVWFGVRPALAWWCAKQTIKTGAVASRDRLLLTAAMALGAALATELIGIHAIFGAFLLGAAFPRRAAFTEAMQEPFADTIAGLFLPIFFAYTGMRTSIGLLATPRDWGVLGLIIALATVGKLGGTYVAARYVGQSRRDAAALGILMNTRGLVELIALNLGLDLGVISPKLFTMFVLMALVTTLATSPLLRLLDLVATARQPAARLAGGRT